MTAPTEPWYFRSLADDLLDTVRKGYELDPSNTVSSLRSAADQIEHLTADRDDARRELAEQKRINTSNLRVMVKEADRVQGQLDQARQMLADAPHGKDCWYWNVAGNRTCDCWKAEL